MVNLFEYFKKPVFLSVLICIFLFYSNLIEINDGCFYYSLINKTSVTQIEGKLLSSPVKCSNEKYYYSLIDLKSSASNNVVKASAKGKIKVYIPSDFVEAYYPGKLYSSAKSINTAFYEAGGVYTFKGKFSNSDFYINDCYASYWENNIFSQIDYFRALCRLQFKRLMFSWNEAGGLLLALLCGSKEYTNKETANAFRDAGLSHILALSGMHLSLFSSIALYFGNKIKRKKLSFVIRIIALYLFIWFAGLTPSLLRAYICAMLVIMSKISGKEDPDMLMILCFSFLLQSIISPKDIHNIGFILSYSALAGILIFNKFFYFSFSKILPSFLSASFSASCSAQVFTIPISLSIFKSISPIGIIATSIVSPLITFFIYLGLILIIIGLLFPQLSIYSAFFLNFLYNIIKFLVIFFSKAPKWSLN